MAVAGIQAPAAVAEVLDQIHTVGSAVINPKTGDVEAATGLLASRDGNLACQAMFLMGLRIQETQAGRAQRVTIAVHSVQFDLTWLAGKLFVTRRDG